MTLNCHSVIYWLEQCLRKVCNHTYFCFSVYNVCVCVCRFWLLRFLFITEFYFIIMFIGVVYLAWGSLNFLELWVYRIIKFGKLLDIIFSNVFVCTAPFQTLEIQLGVYYTAWDWGSVHLYFSIFFSLCVSI